MLEMGATEREERISAMAKKHILVVEDEEDILALLHYNLLREGFRVSLAASGEEGLTVVAEDRPDLVVLDLMLPGMDGLQVCRALKENADTRQIAVVMVTAKGEEADVVAGLELGADDYVTKPFSPRILIARIRSVLRRRSDGGWGPRRSDVYRIPGAAFSGQSPGVGVYPLSDCQCGAGR
jgi:two-component system phosphate regulon response regulator PhoB